MRTARKINDHLQQCRYRAAQGKNEYRRRPCEFVRGGAPRSESVIQMLAGGKHTNANRLAAKRSFITGQKAKNRKKLLLIAGYGKIKTA